jgi:ABC-2 type transport system permease protein
MPNMTTGAATGASAHAKSVLREPTTLAMLAVLPPFVVFLYGAAMQSFPDVAFFSGSAAAAGRIGGALFATAFLSGLVGLFGTVSAAQADRYLSFAGFSPVVLFATRVVVSVAVAAVAGAVSLGAVAAAGTDVASIPLAYLVLVLAGVLYGLLGVVVGALVPRELEGSLVLVFLADLDSFLSGDLLQIDSTAVELLPLHHPHALLTSAIRDGTLAGDTLLPALAYLTILAFAAGVAYAAATGRGWSL